MVDLRKLKTLIDLVQQSGISELEIIKPLISTYHTYDYKGGIALKKTSWFEMRYDGNGKLSPQKEEDIEQALWIPQNKLDDYLDKCFPAVRDVFLYAGLQ